MLSLQVQLNFIHKIMKVHLDFIGTPIDCSDHHCRSLPNSSKMLLEKSTNEKPDLKQFLSEIMFERISMPNTHILEFLSMVCINIDDETQKNINKGRAEIQSFLSSISLLVNDYSFSSLMLCDSMFPNEGPRSSLTGIQYSAFKIINFLEATENYKFIEKVISNNFNENQEFFNNLSETICNYLESQIGEMSIVDENCCVYIRILTKLIELKTINPYDISKNLEILNCSCFAIEFNSLFGSLLTVKILPKRENLLLETELIPRDPIRDFIIKSNPKEIKEAKRLLNFKYFYYVIESTKTIKTLLRSSPAQSLKFLKFVVNLHYLKSKISLEERINPSFEQFSDNFSVNLLSILLEISAPLIDINNEKALKILPDHLKIDISFQRLLGSSIISGKSAVFEQKDLQGTISNYFYCTLFMLRFGWTSLKKMISFLIKHLKKQSDSFGFLSKSGYNNNIIESYSAVILEENRNTKILNFYLFFCELLLKWNNFEGKLPLTIPNVSLFYIPEYILKDFAGFIIFLTYRERSSIFTVHVDGTVDKLLKFTTVLISSRELFPNLKVVNKFIQVFITLIKKKVLLDYSDIFKVNQTARRYLLPSLLIYYSQVEKYQFYDISSAKLIFRRNVCIFLKKLSQVEFFSNKFRSLQHSEEFSKFLNYLFDEITFCFDNGLQYIKKYKDYQDKTKTNIECNDQLTEARHLTTAFWNHINKSLSVILLFSRMKLEIMISEVFSRRFAAFLNHFLKSFNGPEYYKIKIEDPASVNFKPKKTLQRIMEIYVSFMDNENFINQIIGDSRSFNISLFENTFKIISKKIMINTILKEQFTKLMDKLQSASQRLMLIENAPKEFFCELSGEFMTYPVELPSGVIIDKCSLDRHLLTNNFDPYTKVVLSPNNIKELPDLKRRIQEYLGKKV